ALAVAAVLTRALAVVALGTTLAQLSGDSLLYSLMALGLVLLWAGRDLLPDLLAGLVMVLERRVRRGIWVAAEDFAAVVERRGLRATCLRGGRGHRIAVPNVLLLRAPVTSRLGRAPMHEVTVRVPERTRAQQARDALRDAVMASPC